jgi:netrin-G3 ligand
MGNLPSTQPSSSIIATSNNSDNYNLINNIVLQQESDFVEPMISDVDIASIKQHLKSGKPSKEFKFLENEDLDEDETIEAQKLYNREKNRYTNILPCDSTRVKLAAVDGVEGSDYINANFIDGEWKGTERAYIATQGPLMHTRSDFWRMVWENNCKTIVMLGKERENDRIKVDRYWPEPGPDGVLIFGPLTVRGLGKEEVGRGITVRRIELVNTSLNETRSITHYQYEGWPDHGVPTSAKPIRHLIHLIEKEKGTNFFVCDEGSDLLSDEDTCSDSSSSEQTTSPVVVHCSAGVGRTGTFCTIHMLLVRLHNEMRKGSIARLNLYNTVLKLRRQRPGMVQQQEQYIFCYEALAEEAEELGLLPPETSLNNSNNGVHGHNNLATSGFWCATSERLLATARNLGLWRCVERQSKGLFALRTYCRFL